MTGLPVEATDANSTTLRHSLTTVQSPGQCVCGCGATTASAAAATASLHHVHVAQH